MFEVLRYELYKDMLDTNLDTMQVDPLTLRRADLALLLEDLERKLSRVLHPPRSVPWATSTNGCVFGTGCLTPQASLPAYPSIIFCSLESFLWLRQRSA